MTDLRTRIRHLIANGQVDRVIDTLFEKFGTDGRINGIIMQSGRLRIHKRRLAKGTITDAEYDTALNRFSESVLEFVDSLGDQSGNKVPDPVEELEEAYRHAVYQTRLLEVLRAAKDSHTIKEIEDQIGPRLRKYYVPALNHLVDLKLVDRYQDDRGSVNRLNENGYRFVESIF